MEQIKLEPSIFVNEIKFQIAVFIANCESISQDDKGKLITELEQGLNENIHNPSVLLTEATNFIYKKWLENNFKELEFWKQIALNNASVSIEPHKVANEALKAYKEVIEIR